MGLVSEVATHVYGAIPEVQEGTAPDGAIEARGEATRICSRMELIAISERIGDRGAQLGFMVKAIEQRHSGVTHPTLRVRGWVVFPKVSLGPEGDSDPINLALRVEDRWEIRSAYSGPIDEVVHVKTSRSPISSTHRCNREEGGDLCPVFD